MEDKSTTMARIRMLLSEKRTSMSVLRTGLALYTVPISVFTVLTAASEYYSIGDVLGIYVLLVSICVGLTVFGTYLIVRSFRRIRKIDLRVTELKEKL